MEYSFIMFKKFNIICLLLVLLLSTVSAASYYDAGSQRFKLGLGFMYPVSVTHFDTNDTKFGIGEGNTNLKLGGGGSISYQVFSSQRLAIGGEIGYSFNKIIDDTLMSNVPILFKATWFPVSGDIDIPISVGAGISYLSASEGSSLFTLMATADIGVDYYFNPHWGVGLNIGYWIVPELYPANKEKNGLGTFAPATITLTYRQ